MNPILSPSLLSANFSCLGQEVADLEKAGVAWLHLDVMDGAFVPNITFGAPIIKALRKRCGLFFDVHLMIESPCRYLRDFAAAGADLAVFHLEAEPHPQRALALIRDLGLKAGIALNPGTDFSLLRWLLPDVDLILLMGVNPGFSGQKFIPETCAKVRACRSFLDANGYARLPVEVDGGVNLRNAASLVEAGADVLVSGSAFFSRNDYATGLREFNLATGDSWGNEKTRHALVCAAAWRHIQQSQQKD